MERTIKIEIIEGDPHQTQGTSGSFAYATGARLVVYEIYDNTEEDIENGEQKNGFYSYLDGVGDDGNFGETADMNGGDPFETAEQAEQAARDFFAESENDYDYDA